MQNEIINSVLQKLGDPPCNGCTACCHQTVVMLHPEEGDDLSLYEIEILHPVHGYDLIAIKGGLDGKCRYLGKDGCTIHDRRPIACRSFDCRHFYWFALQNSTRQQRQKLVKEGYVDADVLKAARKRMGSLEASETECWAAKVYYGQDLIDLIKGS